MELSEELRVRGLVQDTSAPLENILSKQRTIYIGSDPTADSLHVGHLAWIVLIKRLATAGHTPILLVGGGTGMIGDPKEKGERSLLDETVIDHNAASLHQQLEKLLGSETGLQMVNNAEWLREVRLLPFLRDVGKYFTVNELIKRDIIRRRLETAEDSISYTEFTYSLLQAYDYWELHRRYGVDVQIGGSDQWTNILSGVDLVRKRAGKEVFAFSMPLITDATGRKFGKSEGNAVWLDAQKTSPYQFYQFWLNTDDSKAVDYLKIYTFCSLSDIEIIAQEHSKNPAARQAQRRLAEEVTTFVHGEAAATAAIRVSAVLFGDEPLTTLTEEERSILLNNAPLTDIASGLSLVDILVESGLSSSKREARTFLEGGAISVNGTLVTDIATTIDHGTYGDICLIRRGKKQRAIIRLL